LSGVKKRIKGIYMVKTIINKIKKIKKIKCEKKSGVKKKLKC
jgi:hypothetical protein